MQCSEKQEYTISYTAWEYDFEEWDTRGVKDNAMVILLSDCEKAFFDRYIEIVRREWVVYVNI